jgi:hypothetical protein
MVQLISTFVGLVAACIFGVMAHRSPKKDWDFIKHWPAAAIMILSLFMFEVEVSQRKRLNLSPREFSCEWVFIEGELKQECGWAPAPPPRPFSWTEATVDLRNWFKHLLTSALIDVPVELFGVKLGIAFGRRRFPLPQTA